MSGKIKNGIELSKQSWDALRQNHQLFAFPIISMVMSTLIWILLIIPLVGIAQPILETGEVMADQVWIGLGIILLGYLAVSIILIFSNTALVGVSKVLIEGGEATIGDGIRIAFSHFGKIIKYALITATVGVVARLLIRFGSKSDNFIVLLLSTLLGSTIAAMWSLAVFFAIPVMVYENLSVKDALKRSIEIFRKTWGEGFTGDVAIGGISCLMVFVILIVGCGLMAVGVVNNLLILIILGFLVVVLGISLSNLIYGAVNGVFQTSLYFYAVSGNAGPFINTEMAQEAFLS